MTSSLIPESDFDEHHPLEPARLLASESDSFERRLAASVVGEQIPEASRERLARALGVAGGVAPSTRTFAGKAGYGHAASCAGWGAAGVLAIAVASHALRSRSSDTTRADRETVRTEDIRRGSTEQAEARGDPPRADGRDSTARLAADPLPASRSLPQPVEPQRRETDALPLLRRVSHPGGSSRHDSARSALASGTPQSLRPELAALEHIESALHAHQPDAAASALAAYQRAFPTGELELEAKLLGIDVALAQGRPDQARALARELLARPDAAHYRERLEALASPRNAAHGGSGSQRIGPDPTSREGGAAR